MTKKSSSVHPLSDAPINKKVSRLSALDASKYTEAPSLTNSAEEDKTISIAYQLARKQLIEGTASAQVITHFLKQATVQTELALEKAKLENRLLIEKIESEKRQDSLATTVSAGLSALRSYSVDPQE